MLLFGIGFYFSCLDLRFKVNRDLFNKDLIKIPKSIPATELFELKKKNNKNKSNLTNEKISTKNPFRYS